MIDQIVRNVPELNSPYEEADMSIVLHAAEAAETGAKQLVVLSVDTDIRVLMLYYWRELERKGLNELWFPWFQAIGRYIPIHKFKSQSQIDYSCIRATGLHCKYKKTHTFNSFSIQTIFI